MFDIFKRSSGLTLFTTIFLILYCTYYLPIDGFGGFGPNKFILVVIIILVMLLYSFKMSKAVIIGTIYLLFQYSVASFHPESFRWSTLLFSAMMVYSYAAFYNFIFIEKVFTIDHFIRLCKWIMMAYFIVCIVQQVLIIIGINNVLIINLYPLDRGLGCNSLCREPSTFGRFMLVFYYAYVKCQEYKRDEGPFTLSELFSGEHKWITIRFLWMMLTMGSGTAFVCLILFSLYFVRKHNWYYVIPVLVVCYILLQNSGIEALDRATNTIEATTSLDNKTVQETDGSASARITPIINTIKADYSKSETWLGYGIDAGIHNKANRTLFHDYGFIFYIISLIFTFTCAYNFWSLGCIFMFAGVGGGFGGNIQYTWALAMVMTCVRYFYENRYNPEIYEDEELGEEEASPQPSPNSERAF